jgi:hypothetical protein
MKMGTEYSLVIWKQGYPVDSIKCDTVEACFARFAKESKEASGEITDAINPLTVILTKKQFKTQFKKYLQERRDF